MKVQDSRREEECCVSDDDSVISSEDEDMNMDQRGGSDLMKPFRERGYDLRDSSISDCSSSISSTSSHGRKSETLVSARDPKHGQTALHLAAKKNDCDAMDAILKMDCASTLVNATDKSGNTALHFAVTSNRTRYAVYMVRALLKAGADFNAMNKHGQTPLDVHLLTVKKDDPRVIKVLSDYLKEKDLVANVATALHTAVDRNLTSIASILVNIGVTLNIPDHRNRMISEKVDSKTLIKLISEIRSAPAPVSPEERSRCMKCGAGPFLDSRATKRGLSKIFRNVFSSKSDTIPYSNCYHCGMICCDSCMSGPVDPQTLPPKFDEHTGLIGKGKTNPRVCITCDKVLKIRYKKGKQGNLFLAKAMGYGA